VSDYLAADGTGICRSCRTVIASRALAARIGVREHTARGLCRLCYRHGADPAPVFERDEPAWMAEAVCRGRDPEIWFPLPADAETHEAARRICATCPVMIACLNDALAYGEKAGIRGGLTADERRILTGAVA
jgi:WhiB family redox-sensing transcriptional regulator